LVITVSSRTTRPASNVGQAASSEDQNLPSNSDSIPLGRRIFRLTRRSHDFELGLDGIRGQQIIVRFTAVVLPSGVCAVADYQAFGLAKPEPGRPFGAGSSLQVNATGFSIEPGQQVMRTISADTGSGTVVYRLEFGVLKVFGAKPEPVTHRLFEGW
jgi:hypothetical protein